MKQMLICLILALFLSSASCKEPPIDPPPNVEKTNLEVEWYKRFYSDSTVFAWFENPYFSGNHVVFCSSSFAEWNGTSKIGFGVFDKQTGEKHPAWDFEPGTNFNLSSISNWVIGGVNNNYAVLNNGTEMVCYDISTGAEQWYKQESQLPRIASYGNMIFCAEASQLRARLYKINISTGDRQLVYTVYTTNGYECSFESFIGWEAPWGDSVLVFQNRQWNFPESDGKIDIYAYNLCADTVLWVLEDLTEDGNSSIQKPCIYDNKLLFQGMKSQHCIDLLSGELIWEDEYESGGFYSVPGLCADGRYFARDGYDIYCYDINTGTLLWKIDNTYSLQTEGRMGYYQGQLYFTGLIGFNYIPHIFCLNSIDGSLAWKGNLVSDDAVIQNWKDGIIIDQNTGYLYATDTKGIVCIDLNNTPLDTSK